MCAKEETANPYNQRLMRGILTAFRAWRPDPGVSGIHRAVRAKNLGDPGASPSPEEALLALEVVRAF
jgi:hypothetical protein